MWDWDCISGLDETGLQCFEQTVENAQQMQLLEQFPNTTGTNNKMHFFAAPS